MRIGWLLALGLLIPVAPALGQPYKPPRTSFGAPELEGVWTSASFTRLQRPRDFKGPVATDAEAAAYVARENGRLVGIAPPKIPGEPDPPPDVGDIQSEWYEMDGVGLSRIDGQLRTSAIVDPTNGRLPYNVLGRAAAEAAMTADEKDFRGPEVRMPDERCLIAYGSASGPPMLNVNQNSLLKIVQTPSEIAIYLEMIHEVRIVRIGGSHPKVRTHPWLGDSIGWWEDDTLVVETVDQNPGSANRFVGNSIMVITPAAVITERFTRISTDQIRYEFRVDDPAVFTQPWRAEMVMTATTAPIYEYACHEGNYALPNILAGARETERRDSEAKTR
jgi:hypothetical protein